MTAPVFRELVSESDLHQGYLVLRHLRIGLTETEFRSLYEAARRESGYRFVGLIQEGTLVAVMGFRVLSDFVHGRHLYIDDLVVLPELRSKGLGALCLREAERMAVELKLDGLRLCTGIDNEAGRKFYEREKWVARAVAFKKKIGG